MLIPFKKWAENPSPLKEESLSSWMIRTALSNLNSFSSLLNYINSYYFETTKYNIYKDFDLNWCPDLLEIYSNKTNISINILKGMSLSYLYFKVDEITKIKAEDTWRNDIYKELWFTKWKSSYGSNLRFCPLCLKEDKVPFFRNRWRLRYITFCPIHYCLLENRCPNCNSLIAPYRIKWNQNLNKCYKCNFDLSTIKPLFLNKNDKLFKFSYEFLFKNESTLHDIYNLLSQAWQLQYYNINDNIFHNHPLTNNQEIIKIWEGIKNKYNRDNKRHLFSNINATFLLIGTAIKILKKKNVIKKTIKSFKTIKKPINKIKYYKFPKYANLIEGESISSWLVRTVYKNSMDYYSLINTIPEFLDKSKLYDITNIDFLNISKILKFISMVSKFPLEDIEKMSLAEFNREIDLILGKLETYYNINEFKIIWKTKGIYNYEVGLRYCPLCLREDKEPFFRKIWRLRYIPFCVIHNCFLKETCPNCNQLIDNYILRWDSFNLKNCSKCTADLSNAKPEFIKKNDSLQRSIKEFHNRYGLNAKKVVEILLKAWNKISLLKLSHKIFNNHPLTFSKDLRILWNQTIPPNDIPNRNLLFSNIKSSFLIIGTTIKDF